MSLLALPDKVIVPHIFGQLDLHWLLSSKNKVSKRWNQLIDSTMKHLKEQGRSPFITDIEISQFKYITEDLKVFAHKLLEYFFTLSVSKYDPSRKYKWRVLPVQQASNSNHSTDKTTYRKLFWYGAMRESLIAEGNVLRTYPSYFQGTFFCELEFVCAKSVVEEVRYAIGNYAKGRIRTESGEEWGVLIEGSSKIPLQVGFKLFDDQFVKETVEMGNYFWRPKFTIQRPPHLPSITDKAIDRYFTSAEELKQRSMKFYKHLSQLIYELKDQKWVKISKKPDVTQQQSYQEHNITLTSDERVRAIGWGLGAQKQKMDYIEQHFQSFYKLLKYLNIPNDLLQDATNFAKYPATDFDYVDIENIDVTPKYTKKWCCIL